MSNSPVSRRMVCALHVHTTYSDGAEGVDSIVAAAARAGIDAVLITDHHTMAAARHGWAGWHGGVLVVVGYEHSDPRDENHLLVFGLEEPLDPTLDAPQYVRRAVEAGGVVFVAHPVEQRRPRGSVRPYPWTAPLDLPFQGMEVWNFMSLWVERLTPGWELFHYLWPREGERPDPKTLCLWDRCAATRPVAGVAGLDSHALRVRYAGLGVTVFPHRRLFKGPLTVVEVDGITGRDGPTDTRLLLEHLASGHSIMGLARWGALREVEALAHGAPKPLWGRQVELAEGLHVGMALPRRATVRLLRDGRVVAHGRGERVEFPVDTPGIYRMEAWVGRRMWVLTNHVRVVAPGTASSLDATGARVEPVPRLVYA